MGSITRELALKEAARTAADYQEDFDKHMDAIEATYKDGPETSTVIDFHNQAKINRRSIGDSQSYVGWHQLVQNPRHVLVANVVSCPVEVETPTLDLKIDVSGLNPDQIEDFLALFVNFANKTGVGAKILHTFLTGKVQKGSTTVFPTAPASF